jgi:two-component system chemotaxis sensor kinase CheA
MDLERIKETFFEESQELLGVMEAGLLSLEQSASPRAVVDDIFRAAHSIKGGSGAFGFGEIKALAHALEELLELLRAGQAEPNRARIDVLLAARDALAALVAERRAGREAAAPPEVLAALARTIERVRLGATETLRVRFTPEGPGPVDPIQALDAVTRGGRIRHARVDFGAVPPLAVLDPEQNHLRFELLLESEGSAEAVARALADAKGECVVEPVDAAPVAAAPVAAAPVAAAPVAAAPVAASASAGPRPAPTSPEREAATPVAPIARLADGASIRVPIGKVDRIMNLVGELVITQSMLGALAQRFAAVAGEDFATTVDELNRQVRELQQHVMSVRMVPVGTVFSRFPRVVRDVAVACGKEVELVLVGEDTELDKSIVEVLTDPLTHLVRNCVDHGLEGPDERRAAGKGPVGRLRLAARQQAGAVIVEVSDDGRGLDLGRIREKAVARGILAADAAPPDDQLAQLIFEPGLSTRDVVSDLSGRGVGMDVVRRSVEGVGGSIQLDTQVGQGTRFSIRLPLTLAVLEGQYVAVGGRTYVIPVLAIVESLRVERATIETLLGNREVIRVRDEPVPLIRFADAFGAGAGEAGPPPERVLVVVVESDGTRLALQVDELLGQAQVVVKGLERNYRRVPGFMGATIMGNGEVALIIDVQCLGKSVARGPGVRAAA